MQECISHLILITNNFPFSHEGGESVFVSPEMESLTAEFDVVSVAPFWPNGDLATLECDIDLDVSLGASFPRSIFARVAFLVRALVGQDSGRIIGELVRAYRMYGWRGARKAVLWTVGAVAVLDWLKTKVKADERTLIYTYWNADATVGALFFRDAFQGGNVRVVSRCHGYDLYESRNSPPYLPYRKYVYERLDALVPISSAGAQHASTEGMDSGRISIHRLGVYPGGGACPRSLDGVFRICSCSSIIPIKRVPLIAESVLAFAKLYRDLPIVWTHFGHGSESAVVDRVLAEIPGNLTVRFPGAVSNGVVLDFYRNSPVDVFLNLSQSEGIPMSMMEAGYFGIPIVATAVGGVPEIVTCDSGVLLGENPTVDEVVKGIAVVADSGEDGDERRVVAQRIWMKSYNSKVVHKNFARYLRRLAA